MVDLTGQLNRVWDQQQRYNLQVMQRQQRSSGDWAQTYVLGIVSELGELLTAMKWKQHKLENIEDFGPNMDEELTDITKYIFSLWQLLGFDPHQMLNKIEEKSLFLDKMFQQDFDPSLGDRIVIFDVDGVLADLDGSLVPFMKEKLGDKPLLESDIHVDIAHGWDFERYREAKNLFEATGGYRTLEPLYHLYNLFMYLYGADFNIVTFTARPVNVFRKIKHDTVQWFLKYGVLPDVIKFGRDERISYAVQLQKLGKTVVLVDDNDTTLTRAATAGIPTIKAERQSMTELVAQIMDKADEYEQRLENERSG